MTWQSPTLNELITQTIRDFNAAMPGADAALARNNLFPVAKVLAGGLHYLHRFAAWSSDQRFVLTCDSDQLDRHGAEMKPPVPRKAAAPARGLVTVTASAAASIASGAVLSRSDGARFTVDAGVVIPAPGAATISVTAEAPGASGATSAAAVLSGVSGVTGPASFAVAAGGLGGGADAEGDDAYRSRLLFAKAFPEHAGAPPDYLRYALAVPGVSRAFVDPLAAGRATVVIYPLFDATRPFGVGLESDRIGVETALREVSPGAALVVVRLPVAVPVPITITGLTPATPEVRSAVVAEVADAFAVNGRIAGLSVPHPSMPFIASPESFSVSWIWQAVANATGERRHVITLPAADIALTEGQIAVPGAITFA